MERKQWDIIIKKKERIKTRTKEWKLYPKSFFMFL